MISTPGAGNHQVGDEWIIADLSRSFSVPVKKVQAIYQEQRRRLAEGARIENFLDVLATQKTRSILRDDRFLNS